MGVVDVPVCYEQALRTEVRWGADGALLGSFDRLRFEVHAMGDLDRDGATDLLLSRAHFVVRAGQACLGGSNSEWSSGAARAARAKVLGPMTPLYGSRHPRFGSTEALSVGCLCPRVRP